jgi:PAS domain S-box-containing protein
MANAYLVTISRRIEKNIIQTKDSIFNFIFDAISDAIFLTDLEGFFIQMNETACIRTGINKMDMFGKNLLLIPRVNKTNAIEEYFKELINKGNATAYIDYLNKEGGIIQTEIIGKVVHYHEITLVLHVSREISPRKKEFNQLLDAIIQAEEVDRSFFAQEIHEGLGQILSIIKLYMESYFDTDKPDYRNELADKMDSSINQALSIVSFITEKLSPHILKNLGLEAAINSQIQKIISKSDVKIKFDAKYDLKIPENIEIVLYRIVIDLIDYCLKESKATSVKIASEMDGKNITFVFQQNGKKVLSADFAKKEKNQKLYNLFNKIQSLNGSLEIVENTNQKAKIQIIIPLNTD